MENQKQKKSVGTIALVVLLLIVTIASLVLATYAWAKYSAKSDQSTATAEVAKWDVTLDSETKTFAGTYSHVVTDQIAPGTSGSFAVTIDPGDTEVCIAYQIKLTNATYTTVSGAQTDAIKHLKFYSDAAHTKEVKLDGTVNSDLTGTIDLTGTNHVTAPASSITETIYWCWPYDYAEASAMKKDDGTTPVYTAGTDIEANAEAYDAEDTKVGEGITSMSVKYEIRAWQVDPANSDSTDNTETTNKPL